MKHVACIRIRIQTQSVIWNGYDVGVANNNQNDNKCDLSYAYHNDVKDFFPE